MQRFPAHAQIAADLERAPLPESRGKGEVRSEMGVVEMGLWVPLILP